ncbi:peroxiredoxin [Haloplasma contractile]|uniref:thioredoxin-dependent peroxiredoxin n=1 Tax=Haloplasma contractile SSD-17B TaxID=1033810 RepID=U2FLB8_9MOLU|nr:peroxiredoxin [Haloplasma contractile]ERJ13535.1 peroxiredoxin 6 1-Cys peroxiredoxin protein [Haloplasma contractile SSD-17B]
MLQIGDYVDFNLPGTDGNDHKTEDYKGKVIVLYTYPRDNTPGCTVEAKRFRDLHEEIIKQNAIVIGINKNSMKSHHNFIDKHCLPFNLLVDKDLELLSVLGATKDETKVARKTYIISEKGDLENVFNTVKAKTHPNEVLEYLKNRS